MESKQDIFEQLKEERENRSWIRKKWGKITLWWKFDGKFMRKEFIRGVKKLWYWFPIIWKDRDWDDHYIFEVLKHKLSAQANYIGRRDIHTRAQQDARRMRLCVSLIGKIQDEYYSMEYMDYHKTKHWFEPCEGKEGFSTCESEELEENFDDYFQKYPLIHKRVLNGEGIFKPEGPEDKQRIAMSIAHINQDRAHKLLFKIMEENILGWWD